MNEPPTLADERPKFSAPKRYDPKYRALTEAIRLMEEEEDEGDVGDTDCLMPPPATTSPKLNSGYPPHPKQRHLSNSLAIASVAASTSASTSGPAASMVANTPTSHRSV